MGIVASISFRRKKVIAGFKKNGVNSIENAVTESEINDKWALGGIESLRKRAITSDLKFLIKRGMIKATEDGRYYLINK